jgi:GAF domain-containing protein
MPGPDATGVRSPADQERAPDAAGDVEAFLADVAGRLDRAVAPSCGAAVTLRGPRPRTGGASNELAARVDAVQYDVGTGPCLTTLASGQELHVPDLAADTRWAEYGRRAAELGVRACFSAPVVVDDTTIAVLKVYADHVRPFGPADLATVRLHAREVAGGLLLAGNLLRESATTADLRAAMATRRVIDLALGVLMAQAGVGPDEAFALLTRASQDRNIKLNVLAARLVESVAGAAPEPWAPFTPRSAAPPPPG